jgi:hypothetical protein
MHTLTVCAFFCSHINQYMRTTLPGLPPPTAVPLSDWVPRGNGRRFWPGFAHGGIYGSECKSVCKNISKLSRTLWVPPTPPSIYRTSRTKKRKSQKLFFGNLPHPLGTYTMPIATYLNE